MNRTVFATALCAVSLLASHADARLALSEAKCVDARLAPADRVDSCITYLNDGLVGHDLTDTQFALGYAYRLNGDYAKAEASMTDLITRFPTWPNPLIERSTAYAEDGKYDLALADVAALKTVNSDPALGSMQRCWVRGIAGKELDAGLADCDAALKFYPKAFAVFIARALVDYKRGDMASAIADCTAALEDKPKSAAALYLRGLAKGAGGADDIASAKDREPYVGQEFVNYGITGPK